MGAGAVAVSQDLGLAHLVDPRPWYKNRRLVALNGWILLLLITSSTNGYDGSMMNGVLSLDTFEKFFDNPQGGRLGLFNAIQNIGSLCGLPFAPYITDWTGRRRAIAFGAIIMICGAILQAAAQNFSMFIGARFLMGFGLTFATNAAPLLVSEISYPTHRAPLTSCYNSLWYSGAVIAAFTTLGTFHINNNWSWRIPSALQALPSVIQIFLIWFVPESPRWLISKGREAEARRILGYWHGNGDEQHPLVEFEFNEIKAAIDLDRNVAANVGYKSLFTTKGNLKRLRIIVALAFFSQWSGNGLISYYLHAVFDAVGITDTQVQLIINACLQLWNLFWAVGAGLLCDRLGRRRLFLWSCFGMLLFYVLETICFQQAAVLGKDSAAHALIAFVFLYYASYDIAFSPLIVSYTVEILPYPIRAKGFNLFNLTVSAAIIFNQYVNPIAFGKISWKYFIVYDCWIAFELVYLYFFLVETKNRSLEETAVIFDGEDHVQRVQAAAHVAEKDFDGSVSEKELKA
ncbi:hypothetical protein M422DRAFT_261331 [Sphaerobolus stellatus SS14]|uniref:Major facilitator superfamily (MFS) profile domain-containing protein n=1 Tax=Sphaerobolus stellatus (strain SS14) TaxID=990650 RepID=A0A0C9UNF4_SPHS4|nr:hypothetical protein M422DRAFT_261331 [Sphaerobolus stellatus SS14]